MPVCSRLASSAAGDRGVLFLGPSCWRLRELWCDSISGVARCILAASSGHFGRQVRRCFWGETVTLMGRGLSSGRGNMEPRHNITFTPVGTRSQPPSWDSCIGHSEE